MLTYIKSIRRLRTKINKCIISHAVINETKILNGQA